VQLEVIERVLLLDIPIYVELYVTLTLLLEHPLLEFGGDTPPP